MSTSTRARTGIAFRVIFGLYTAALLVWLVLGLLPSVADNVAALRHALATLAAGNGLWAGPAGRVLHPPADMATRPSGAQVVWQYLFSLLNLVLGLLLMVRRGGELVPRLLGFALLGTAATFNEPSHRVFHILGEPWPITLAHFTFHIVSGVAYLWAVILFPDGVLPPRLRVRPAWLRVWVVGVTAATALICWRSSFLAHPQFFVVFFGVAVPVVGVGAQLLRLADPETPPEDRRLSRLLCAALLPALGVALVWLAARVLAAAGSEAAGRLDVSLQQVFPAAFALVPVALVAGMIRYRLWDLDRALTRVLGYGVLLAVVSAVYVAAVSTGGWLAGGRLWWAVLALSVLAVVIEPIRTFSARWANRVVYGQALSPAEALRTLVDGLQQLTPTGELDQLAAVAVRATRAQECALWVCDGDALVRAAAAPAADEFERRVPLPAGDAPAAAVGADQTWPVTHQGALLGVLAVCVPGGGALPETDARLLADLAAHAGLLVQNALLTVRLARHVAALSARADQLRTARRQLVAAQDAERRRLERDLHDGAQQALVATIIGVRTLGADGLDAAERDRELAELAELISGVRAELAELGAAPVPRALAELGLAGALRSAASLAARAGLAVDVDVDTIGLHGAGDGVDAAQAAVYYCCVEALQNMAKHAGARHGLVQVRVTGGELCFAVVDDGSGFDAARTGDPVAGLAQLANRLTVLGGSLVVNSAPGQGTRVRGAVPLAEAAADAMPVGASR